LHARGGRRSGRGGEDRGRRASGWASLARRRSPPLGGIAARGTNEGSPEARSRGNERGTHQHLNRGDVDGAHAAGEGREARARRGCSPRVGSRAREDATTTGAGAEVATATERELEPGARAGRRHRSGVSAETGASERVAKWAGGRRRAAPRSGRREGRRPEATSRRAGREFEIFPRVRGGLKT
jgi:hypothetical protein